MDEELPAFLTGHRDQGALVLFVLADHCYWQADPIVSAHQMVPRDGKPIVAHRYLAEAALLAGHLALDQATVRGRREAELHLLEARLKHRQVRPDEAREALVLAEARIRALGQWGLWPQLTQVAEELGAPAPIMD